jgi:hypothetical protein
MYIVHWNLLFFDSLVKEGSTATILMSNFGTRSQWPRVRRDTERNIFFPELIVTLLSSVIIARVEQHRRHCDRP